MFRKWLFIVVLAMLLITPTGVFAAEKALPAVVGGEAAGGSGPAVSREKAKQIAGEIIPEMQAGEGVQATLDESRLTQGNAGALSCIKMLPLSGGSRSITMS